MAEGLLAGVLGKRAPKTRRGKKILQRREPQVEEEPKTALIIRGNKCSIDGVSLLRDLHRIRDPLATLFMRKHSEHPFEDVGRLESLCAKYDHGLFVFCSSSKKRPFRLILGRLFDKKLLDMQEFNVDNYKPMHSFGPNNNEALAGSKPLVVFQGSAFETDERVKRVKSLLLDFFSGPRPEKVVLEGLEHVVVASCFDGSATASSNALAEKAGGAPPAPAVSVARFRIKMLKSGSRLPRVELEEVGPRFRLSLDRSREPERERWKLSIKVPKQAKTKKVKNITTGAMGKRRGKIHLGKQDFDQIHTVHHSKAKQRKLNAELALKRGGQAGDAATAEG